MIEIQTIVVSDFQQNCRVLFESDANEILIIDPGANGLGIFEILKSKYDFFSLEKITILATHLHIDHVGGVKDLLRALEEESKNKVELLYHAGADQYKDTIQLQANLYGLSVADYKNVPAASSFIKEGDELFLGKTKIEILDTPGHAEGHVSLFFPVSEFRDCDVHFAPFLIAGDTLFYGSIGRTDLPGGNHELLINSIKQKIFKLPAETIVLSGHGPNTDVGFEKQNNPFLT